jgi:hypothetical protein
MLSLLGVLRLRVATASGLLGHKDPPLKLDMGETFGEAGSVPSD